MDLARAFPDLHQTHVPDDALHRIVAQVAVAAEDLERRVRGAARGLGRVELPLGCGASEGQTVVGQGRGAVDEEPARVELGPRLRELPLDHLELGERLAELLALLRVRGGGLDGRAAEPDRERADADAAAIEDLPHVAEGGADLADPIGVCDTAVGEHELGCIGSVQSHLLLALAGTKAGVAGGDAERGEPAVRGRRDHDDESGDRAVRDELLRAVEDPPVAVAARGRLRRDRVRAGARFGERPRPEMIPAGERRQPAGLLLRRGGRQDVPDAERVVCGEGEGDRPIAGPELLCDERRRDGVETGTGELGRDRETGEPERRELGQERHRELAALAPLRGARHDPLAHERADRVADRELIVPVAEVHYG